MLFLTVGEMLAGHSIGEEGNSHGVRRRFVSHCGGDRFVGGHCGGGLCCSGRSIGDFVVVGRWIGGHCGGGPCCMYSRGRFSGDFVVVVRCNSGRGGSQCHCGGDHCDRCGGDYGQCGDGRGGGGCRRRAGMWAEVVLLVF